MSIDAMTWAFGQDLPPGPKFVLVVLADGADDDCSCWPGQERIARKTGQGVRTVRRHLEELEALGFITRQHRSKKDGTRNSDRYIIHMQDEPTNRPNETGQPASLAAGQPASLAGNPSGLEPSEEPSERKNPPTPFGGTPQGVAVDGNGFSPEVNAERKLEFRISGSLPKDAPIVEMVDVYHSIVTSGARVQVLNQKRINQLNARWRDIGRSIQAWAAFCHRVQASPFLTGQVASQGKEPFSALDIGWITGNENYVKITEGRFDGGKRESRNREVFDDFVARHS